jgi:rubrerythrin
MSEVGPDIEIWEFAIAREMEAVHFYRILAKRTKSPEMRKVFEDLADEELEHKAKLELELMKIGKTVVTEEKSAGLDIKYEAEDTGPDLNMDYKDMLLLGIEKEEASFRTYVTLIGTVHDQESREALLAIAEEEVKHKLRFELEYDMLLKES